MHKWIFGRAWPDLLFVLFPGMIAILLLLLVSEVSLTYVVLAFFAATFLDTGHVYTTVWRTFFRKKEVTCSKLYWIAPLCVFFGFSLWSFAGLPFL